jgi:deoxyribodipyrimidine photo-lyase
LSATAAEVPAERLSALNSAPADPGRDYVLYWQVMARRTRSNFALEHAVALARGWGRPLVVLEALRAGYPWANDRLHRFALDGMHDNAAAYADAGVAHHAYAEPEPGAARGLLEALAERACVVVTDEFPEFFLPRMLRAAAERLAAAACASSSWTATGCCPLRAGAKAWTAAPHFRRQLQRELPRSSAGSRRGAARRGAAGCRRSPATRSPTWRASPSGGRRPAPRCSTRARPAAARSARCPSTTAVPPVAFAGGPAKARVVLDDFLARKLDTYARGGTRPRTRATAASRPTCTGAS